MSVEHSSGFKPGDQVVVTNGTFIGMPGTIIVATRFYPSIVRIELSIFGRTVPVELETWQIKHAAES